MKAIIINCRGITVPFILYIHEKANKGRLVISEVAFLGLLLVFFGWTIFSKEGLHQSLFLGYCFVFSFFYAFQFHLAVKMIGERKSPATGCLAADLTGAAVGTLVVGTLLIPLLGIQSAIIFLILIKISSSIIMTEVFRGLKSERDAEIGQNGRLWMSTI